MLQEGGKFDKQSFVVHWEEKDVICQVHTLGSFALYVKQRQEEDHLLQMLESINTK